jgi:hypothetical protein
VSLIVLAWGLGLFLPDERNGSSTPSLIALGAANDDSSNSEGFRVKFRDGTMVPAVGQGSWHLAQGRHPQAIEEGALGLGLSLGMRLIDTAELYGEGRAEGLISRVIAGQRDRV